MQHATHVHVDPSSGFFAWILRLDPSSTSSEERHQADLAQLLTLAHVTFSFLRQSGSQERISGADLIAASPTSFPGCSLRYDDLFQGTQVTTESDTDAQHNVGRGDLASYQGSCRSSPWNRLVLRPRSIGRG
jgi:hypothetical protein